MASFASNTPQGVRVHLKQNFIEAEQQLESMVFVYGVDLTIFQELWAGRNRHCLASGLSLPLLSDGKRANS